MLNYDDIKIGDVLNCINVGGFTAKDNANKVILLKFEKLVVVSKCDEWPRSLFLSDDKISKESINESELKFFEVVGNINTELEYTFEYLETLVERAFIGGFVKSYHKVRLDSGDGVIRIKWILTNSMDDTPASAVDSDDRDMINKWCKWFEGSKKETFTIQNNHCVLKIRKGATLRINKYHTAIAVEDGVEDAPYNYVDVKLHPSDTKTFQIPHRMLVGIDVEQDQY